MMVLRAAYRGDPAAIHTVHPPNLRGVYVHILIYYLISVYKNINIRKNI